MKLRFLATVLMAAVVCTNVDAQQRLTKDQILNMSIEELSELPLEDLMDAVETLGVSSVDELFAMIMNKNVSSASKEEENSFTSPLSTTVITKAEMRTYGISTIEEAFRLIPGMIVTEKLNGIYDIQMRGLNNIPDNNMLLYTENANTLLMIDGRPVQNCVMGALTFDMQPISIEDVDRIEVVRGACGALYGSNAVSGVINIITDKPNSDSHKASGSLQMGNNDTYIGDVALRNSFLNNKLSLGLTFNMQQRGRGTDKLYVLPQQGQVIGNTPEIVAISDQMYTYGNIKNGYVQAPDGTAIVLNKDFASAQEGGWYTLDEIQNMRQVMPTALPLAILGVQGNEGDVVYTVFNSTEPETPIKSMFHNSGISRKNWAVNGYITLTPAKDIRFDLTGGYSETRAMNTPVGSDIFSMNERNSNGGYFNLNSHIKGLSLNYGYEFGPQDYANGVPGFKIWHKMMNTNAEYIFQAGDLKIKPAVEFQWAKFTDYLPVWNDATHANKNYTWHYEDYNGEYDAPADDMTRLYGFLNGTAKLYTIAPSLRLDYKYNDFRFIAAYRADKTSIPDKWNHSWQFAANYSINDHNFIRLVYGRANRGTNLVNSSAKYQWIRTNMQPGRMIFVGNEDADLVKIDNIELGYRWKPLSNVLVDAELFYSMSSDFGALMSKESMQACETSNLYNVLGTLLPPIMEKYQQVLAGQMSVEQFSAFEASQFQQAAGLVKTESRTYIQYNNLPYKVNQMGLSFNIDWIISPKLIAKLNANVQKTTIDDYYEYSQTTQVQQQLNTATTYLISNLYSTDNNLMVDVVNTLLGCAAQGGDYNALFDRMMKYVPVNSYKQQVGYNDMNATQKQELLNNLYQAGMTNTPVEGVENPLAMYYAIRYNVLMNGNDFYFGSTEALPYSMSNGHKHKATPSAYGMLGLIYKPTNAITVSAFGNYIGKRTYDTQYGSQELDGRFTVNMKVGYSPVSGMELFFNAHNLFNSEKQEFNYCDKIGGLYTVGVNFEL